MRNARKLTLKRESLTALTTEDLSAVAGGQELTHATCGLCLTKVWSYDRCPTTPVNDCTSIIAIEGTVTCK